MAKAGLAPGVALLALVVVAACGGSKHGPERRTGGGAGQAGTGAAAGAGATSGRGVAGRAGAAGSGGQSGDGAGGSGSGRAGASAAGGANGGTSASGGRAGQGAGGSGGAGRAGSGGSSEGGEGPSAGSDAGGAGGALDLGPLGGLIDAFCTTARACCRMAGQPDAALDHCEESFLAQSVNTSLAAAGKVSINQTALGACIAAYQEAETSCVVNGIQAACHGILVGSVADDGSCTDVAECDRSQSPKVCQKYLNTGDVGTCQTPPRGHDGDPCALSCAVGANCSTTALSGDGSSPTALCYEADGLYCKSGYDCTPLVADGGYCNASEACGSDGYCDGESCTALVASGDTCTFGPACGSGFACVEGHCTPAAFANSSACVGYPPYFD